MEVPFDAASIPARRRRGRPTLWLALAAGFLVLPACSGGDGPTPPPGGNGNGGELSLAFRQVVSGLDAPTYLTAPPGDDRLFVLERAGRVRIVRDDELMTDPFLDLSGAVEDAGGEQGLLGMAFDPDFSDNGRFYLNFTVAPGGGTRVVRYTVSDPAADRAEVASADTLLAVDQPASNHNGGMLAVGPDGMLYVALGDGGGANDQFGNGQDSTTVLGTILRLDPDAGPPFAPGDNPFVGRSGDDRIWAYGLRNPWRFAFDPGSGTLLVADVGQSDREEVNAVGVDEAGVNYGWSVMEGSTCFDPPEDCDQTGLTLPVLDYGHDEGCSVTGGFVYRGSAIPDAVGRYFYSDFCTGFLRSFRLEDGEAVDRVEHPVEDPGSVTSFGTDGDGELHLLTNEGRVLRIVSE